jgi:DNA-binding NarL/FixJ family response regulator
MVRPRLVLADDHPSFLEAASAHLSTQFEVVVTAADGAALVLEALRVRPDAIVTDITMPVMSGIDALHELRKFALSAKVVFLTIHSEEQFVQACFAEGALGYVVKSHMKTDLIPALKAALNGKSYISPSLTVRSSRRQGQERA